MKSLLFALLLALALSVPARAQTPQNGPQSPLTKRAADMLEFLQGKQQAAKIFAPSFLAAVPVAQLATINDDLKRNYGDAVSIQSLKAQGENSAVLKVDYSKGYRVTIGLRIEAKAPHLIGGLLLSSTEKIGASLESIVADLKALPGQTALSVARLSDQGFEPVISHNADMPLAIGSAFKLYVLSELQRSIVRGERKWTNLVELREASFPSGFLQNWPVGSPLTLHTLAALMISQSDNTATDQLIEVLGRENIEKMVATAGNAHAARNAPFLKTRELFALKGAGKGEFAARYIKGDVAAKRALLAGEIARFSDDKVNFDFLSAPSYIDQIEWFASTSDVTRALNWLRLHSADDDEVRGILGINQGLTTGAAGWKYVGFKGGSETGVIHLSYLLQANNDQWFAVSATWNDEKAAVEEGKFAFLIQQAIELARPK